MSFLHRRAVRAFLGIWIVTAVLAAIFMLWANSWLNRKLKKELNDCARLEVVYREKARQAELNQDIMAAECYTDQADWYAHLQNVYRAMIRGDDVGNQPFQCTHSEHRHNKV